MTGEQLKCILYAAGIPQAELAKKGVSGDAGTPKLLKHTIMVCGAKVLIFWQLSLQNPIFYCNFVYYITVMRKQAKVNLVSSAD